MIIYLASYLECIHDGNWMTISPHKTKKGAVIAMEFHKNECRKEYDEMIEFCKKENVSCSRFGETERWDVFETELLE